jgi:predicted TIM-barrel fold metal-dependent hydrolase
MYREYVDGPWHDEFETWLRTQKAHDPQADERKLRSWDDTIRNAQQHQDGVVGEVIFPDSASPFSPTLDLFAPPPTVENYGRRRAGIQAHNRWLVDFCANYPKRRAGIAQIFVNNLDDTVEDVVWAKKAGLRGGILLPPAPPDASWILPYNHPAYDRLWAVCQDFDVPINIHGGIGAPVYAPVMSSLLLMTAEAGFYARRPLLHMLLSGVFERFPRLRVVLTEQGCGWVPHFLFQNDQLLETIPARKALGKYDFSRELSLPRSATEYFHQNVWIGGSGPTKWDAKAAKDVIGLERFMWGSDFPHDEGTSPYTREHLRQVFSSWPVDEMRKILAENAARFYDFDLAALDSDAAHFGPTPQEIAVPLEHLPDPPNVALLRAAGLMYAGDGAGAPPE